MTDIDYLLKPTEAAVVSGVELNIVNHAIDRMLPRRLVQRGRGRGRGVSAEACFYIAFYHGSAKKLTPEERLYAIQVVSERADEPMGAAPWKKLVRHCLVHHEYLNIDLKPFLTATHARWDRYFAAREAVTSTADVLGGTPVIKGTRVPVHDVAASVTANVPPARILEAYPSLTQEQVELASLYARANPLKGRPPERPTIERATVISERIVERRQTPA